VVVSASMRLEYVTANDWTLLRSKARQLAFRPREVLIHFTSRPNTLFVLKKGSATVEVARGKVIARLGVGDICGEMAFVENDGASASVVAESEIEVEAFDVNDVLEIFATYPHLEARFYKSIALVLSKRLRITSSQLSKLVQAGQSTHASGL